MTNKAFFVFLFFCSQLLGAPSRSDIQYELQNLQSELQMVFARMETQENLIATLRQEIESTLNITKGQSSGLSGKFTDMDTASKALSKDIISLRDHFNQTIQQVDKLSKDVERHSKNIKQLEIAMKAIIEACAPEKEISIAGYKVKSGDSLEKIAKEHSTTPKKIKELNNLKNDNIFAGQNLVLP